jgi:ubiquinone biosynthesis monooxygenase Coq7
MLDKLIVEFDKVMQTLLSKPISRRSHPDLDVPDNDNEFSDQEKSHIVGLMRVNHCGEICAQGLYQGQALTSRDKLNRDIFAEASAEETEHLAWLHNRIMDLGGHTSILNPLFYLGSLSVGILAGVCGDKWSLGFLEETERQVEAHLANHLEQIPMDDDKSRAILEQMIIDERGHADTAHNYGAANLPKAFKVLMQLSSKIMTKTTYYL